VATGEGWEERVGGGVKVSMAEQWGKNRCVWS
jgi:type 2A phosphatase activator TIP41